MIRFTPRKPASIWSAVNIAKIEQLQQQGLMRPAGIAAYEKRKDERSKIYSYENEPAQLSEEFEKQFKANDAAWTFFAAQAPYYKKAMTHWVISPKRDETRRKRLKELVTKCEEGKRMI